MPEDVEMAALFFFVAYTFEEIRDGNSSSLKLHSLLPLGSPTSSAVVEWKPGIHATIFFSLQAVTFRSFIIVREDGASLKWRTGKSEEIKTARKIATPPAVNWRSLDGGQ